MNQASVKSANWLQYSGVWLRQIAVLTQKEFPQLIRDRAIFIYILYIFSVQIILAAGMTLELRNADIAIYDADNSATSRELVHRFQSPYFDSPLMINHPDQGLQRLDRGDITLFMELPPNFSSAVKDPNQSATVQLLVDTSKTTAGYLTSSYSTRITYAYGNELMSARIANSQANVPGLPAVDARKRIWFNQDINESWFSTLAEVISMVTIACILLPAIAMVRERERGTLEQLLVSPISPAQLMLAKITAMVVITQCGVAFALFVIMQWMHSVPSRGSLPLFFLLTAVYTFATAGLGLLAATFTRTTGQVGMVLLLIVIPLITLSGMWTLLEAMPTWLSFIMYFSPLRHFVEIAFGILLRGAGLIELRESIAMMMLLGVTLFSLALIRLNRQFR